MSVDAVAVIRVPYADVCRAQDLSPAPDHGAALEATFPFVPVGTDATGCFLGVPYMSASEDLAAVVRQIVGASLDAHDDERGIAILADAGWPDDGFASYEDAVAAAPKFAPQISDAELRTAIEARMQSAGFGALASQMAELSMQMGVPQAGSQGQPELGGGILEAAQQMLASMSPEQRAQIEAMAQQVFGMGDEAPPEKAEIVDDEFGDPDQPAPPKK